MNSHFLQLCLTSILMSLAYASIPSFGLQTVASIRDKLPDSAFRITPNTGIVLRTDEYTVSIADLSNFPALAGQDVQSEIIRVSVKSGKELFRHYHPRASEVVSVVRGTFNMSFTFEGLSPRVVSNTIHTGQSMVIPQGLVHTSKCVSKKHCMFLAVLPSADPGIIPI